MNDRALGGGLVAVGVLALAGYAYLLIVVNTLLALQIVALIAVGAVCFILAWIGYTLLTTPAPAPIEVTPTEAKEEAKPGQPSSSS